jgi:hypothetical protein
MSETDIKTKTNFPNFSPIRKGDTEIEIKVRDAIRRGNPNEVGLTRLANKCDFITFNTFSCNSRASYMAQNGGHYCELHAILVACKYLEDEKLKGDKNGHDKS